MCDMVRIYAGQKTTSVDAFNDRTIQNSMKYLAHSVKLVYRGYHRGIERHFRRCLKLSARFTSRGELSLSYGLFWPDEHLATVWSPPADCSW